MTVRPSVRVCDIMLTSTLEEFLMVLKVLKKGPREGAQSEGLKREGLKKGLKRAQEQERELKRELKRESSRERPQGRDLRRARERERERSGE